MTGRTRHFFQHVLRRRLGWLINIVRRDAVNVTLPGGAFFSVWFLPIGISVAGERASVFGFDVTDEELVSFIGGEEVTT